MSQEKKGNIAANVDHFDSKWAQQYDNEMSFRMSREIARSILQFKHEEDSVEAKIPSSDETLNDKEGDPIPNVSKFWDENKTRVLDFACGTGLISINIAPYVKQIVGVDIADEMLKIFNHKIHNQGIPKEEMAAFKINIFEEEDIKKHENEVPGGLDGFDAVVASLAYHHIDDIDLASRSLFARLRSGGWAYIVDLSKGKELIAGEGGYQDKDEVVPHRGGFTTNEMKATLEQAGFKNISVADGFGVTMWATQDYLDKFRLHHVVSKIEDQVSTHKEIHGIRIYKEKEENGVKKYLIKKRMFLATGQRP